MVKCRDCYGMTFDPDSKYLYRCKSISKLTEDPDRERMCNNFINRGVINGA